MTLTTYDDNDSPFLDVLEVDDSRADDMAERIGSELPTVGELFTALGAFCQSVAELDGDELFAEAYDLRRSELVLTLGCVDEAREYLAAVVRLLSLEDRLTDAEDTDTIFDRFNGTGEALLEAAKKLVETPGRSSR
ncbi:hypothetical protein ACQP1W_52390 (plasmid) [Spirillospora sp. CA-255316]